MQPATAPEGRKGDETYLTEIVRLAADEYGAKNEETDAAEMAIWFNELRALALEKRLPPDAAVTVPEGFRANAIAVGTASRPKPGRATLR
jgi:hypothetical protein